jgi:hypothetical protein
LSEPDEVFGSLVPDNRLNDDANNNNDDQNKVAEGAARPAAALPAPPAAKALSPSDFRLMAPSARAEPRPKSIRSRIAVTASRNWIIQWDDIEVCFLSRPLAHRFLTAPRLSL